MPISSSLAAQLRWFYRAWRYRLRVERAETRCLLDRIGPGDTVIDIGAHEGAHTYWMRRGVGAGGRVFAFEPQPTLAEHLYAMVAARNWDNVTVENLGLSSGVGTLNLKLPHADGSPSASFEHTAHTSAESLEISVRVTTLDDYFSNRVRHSPGAIRLIKCDAEGHELEVFKGGEQLLREVGPDLLFECEARHRCRPVDEVFGYLASLGYEGWYLGPNGMTSMDRFEVSLHQADSESDQYVNNFFYKRPDRPGA